MAPTIYAAKFTLSCPLFAADFDPRDNGRLFVGGGGGEGRSGVGNKISLIDTSRRDEISEAVELNLSRDEDSVTSLAAAPQIDDDGHSLVALAGINSSLAEQKKNNNQHMRAFRFQAPRKVETQDVATTGGEQTSEGGKEKAEKKEVEITPGSSEAVSRESIFRTKGPGSDDTYQRIMRLSPWKKQAEGESEETNKKSEDTRIGAIATGMASSGEIVFFKATGSPSESDVIGRIRLAANEEAEDVDFADLELDPEQKNATGKYRMAYTNGVDVMVGELSSSTRSNAAPDVRNIYTIPLPSSGAKAARPKIRALRFLSINTILLLQNAPDRGGSELVLINVPTDKKRSSILRRRKLPRNVKIGLGLDVCTLGTNPAGQQQTIVAASGSDNSINIWTLESGPVKGWSRFRPYTTLNEVHPFSMTKLVFSTFIPPSHPVTPEVLPQRVKLASISMGNTVVVHTLPLSPFPPSSRTPRYVLVAPGPAEFWEFLYFTTMCLLSFVTILTALYAFAEIRGGVPPFLGSTGWLPISWQNTIANEYVPPPLEHRSFLDTYFLADSHSRESNNPIPTAQVSSSETDGDEGLEPELSSLKEILDRVHLSGAAPADLEEISSHEVSVIVRCSEHNDAETSVLIETASSTHAEKVSEMEKLKAWKELSESDRDLWKRRLTDAGRWTVGQGESVLKGVLFGEVCGGIGRVVREGLE